jgi:hypothetical protein
MTDNQKKVLDKWLEGRPEAVKKLAYEFPPYTRLKSTCDCHDDTVVVGYTDDDDRLICSELDMFGNYDIKTSKLYVKAQDLRDGKVQFVLPEPPERRSSYDYGTGKDKN